MHRNFFLSGHWPKYQILVKILAHLICFKLVASEDPNLAKIIYDLTIPLNNVLSGGTSKTEFKETLISSPIFRNNEANTDTVYLLYAAGPNNYLYH